MESNKILSLLGDPDDNYSSKKYSSELYTDIYFYLEDDENRAMVVFGNEKVVIGIFTSEDEQKKLQKVMDEHFKFPE